MMKAEWDLHEVPDTGLSGLHDTMLPLAKVLTSPAWRATVMALVRGVSDEIGRRRRGEPAGAIAVYLGTAVELSPSERKALVGDLKQKAFYLGKNAPLAVALRSIARLIHEAQ